MKKNKYALHQMLPRDYFLSVQNIICSQTFPANMEQDGNENYVVLLNCIFLIIFYEKHLLHNTANRVFRITFFLFGKVACFEGCPLWIHRLDLPGLFQWTYILYKLHIFTLFPKFSSIPSVNRILRVLLLLCQAYHVFKHVVNPVLQF